MYGELLQQVLSLTRACESLYAPVVVGSLPGDDSIAAYISAGAPVQQHLDRGSVNELYITVKSRHSSHETALNALSDIHTRLTRLKTYPGGEGWQILDIATGTAPHYIDPQDSETPETPAGGSQQLYVSSLKITFYIKGVD